MTLPPTPFTRIVGCRLPLQQAGMGGVTTPALVAAVAAEGGLGMVAAAGITAAQVRAQVVAALELAEAGYVRPQERRDVLVSGNEGLGLVYVGAHSMQSGGYISSHDQLISEKLGYVLSGGDLTERTRVSEQYLLDLERRAFVELCMERKTLERMQSLIQQGKILRN